MSTLNENSGFAIKEFLIAILSISLIAALAVPGLYSITNNTQNFATTSVASALTSTNGSNFVVRNLNKQLGYSIQNCKDIENTMPGGIPSGYTIVNGRVTNNSSIACTLNGPKGTSARFTVTGIS